MQKANLVFLTIFSVTFSCSNETVSCQKLEKVNSDQQKKGFKFLIFSRVMFNVLEEYNDDKTKQKAILFYSSELMIKLIFTSDYNFFFKIVRS